MKKCIILIDGSNFYFKLKDLEISNLLDFDFARFSEYLAKDYKIVKTIYFVGKIQTDGSEKSNRLLKNQQRLFAHFRNNKVEYSLGYLLKIGNAYHEKGVDVNLATNILVSAYENLADLIIVISSDTDLLPAIKKSIEIGKTVLHIGFKHKVSKAMISNCSKYWLLSKAELLKFMGTKKLHKQS